MHATSMESTNGLYAGEVGYIAASIKTLADAKVGDTVTLTANPAKEPLPGYREAQPMVYCGIYPVDGAKYGDLKDALENYSSTMRRSPLSRKPRLLSDLAIAADSSDFFIWRLFRKDLSVNISLTLLQPHRA